MKAPRLVALVVLATAFFAGCGRTEPPQMAPVPLSHPVQRGAWSFAGRRGQVLWTKHYQVFTTVDTPALRDSMPGFLEACRRNYTELTGLPAERGGDKPMSVYLFSTRREWAMLTEKVTGLQAPTYLRVESGGYCFAGKCVFWDMGMLPTYSVAAHEGMHQFLYHRMSQPLPPWAEEGLAVLSEGFRIHDGMVRFQPDKNVMRFTNVRSAILGGRWRPAERLVAMGAGQNIHESVWSGPEYYGQLWALGLLIRSDPEYASGLQRMLADASAGKLHETLGIPLQVWARLQRNGSEYIRFVGPRAFAHYIDADLNRFEQRYLSLAKKLAGVR